MISAAWLGPVAQPWQLQGDHTGERPLIRKDAGSNPARPTRHQVLEKEIHVLKFDITTRDEGPVTVITVTGDLDVYAAPLLRQEIIRQEITSLVETGQQCLLVADLSGCTYMDSTGLGVLVGGLKKVRAHGGELCVADAPERIHTAFRISGLVKVFAMHESAADAVAALMEEAVNGAAL